MLFHVHRTLLERQDGRKSNDFLKGRRNPQIIVTYFIGDFSTKQRKNLNTSAGCFQVVIIPILAIRGQTHLIIVSENW